MPLDPKDIPAIGGLAGPKVLVQFRILTMRWRPVPATTDVPYPSTKEGLRQLVYSPKPVPEDVDLKSFILAHLDDSPEPFLPRVKKGEPKARILAKTPWDIDIEVHHDSAQKNRPRVLIVHLDPKFEWEFSKGTRAVTGKHDISGEDAGLHYIDPITRTAVPMPDEGLPIGCSTIYWSILKRPALPDPTKGAEIRQFNFHIDLINPDTDRHMPTIFDPNIPDNGGATIP